MDLRTTHKESTAEIGAHGNEGARTESRTHYINENIIFVMSNEKEQNHKVQATRKERPSGLRRRFRHNDLRRAVGWGAAKDEARKVYDAFREAYGNFIDNANLDTNGTSESFLSEFMSGHRQSVVPAQMARRY